MTSHNRVANITIFNIHEGWDLKYSSQWVIIYWVKLQKCNDWEIIIKIHMIETLPSSSIWQKLTLWVL